MSLGQLLDLAVTLERCLMAHKREQQSAWGSPATFSSLYLSPTEQKSMEVDTTQPHQCLKTEDTSGGKDRAFAVMKKATGLNNLHCQTKAGQSGGICTSALAHNIPCHHPLGAGALSSPLCPWFCGL